MVQNRRLRVCHGANRFLSLLVMKISQVVHTAVMSLALGAAFLPSSFASASAWSDTLLTSNRPLTIDLPTGERISVTLDEIEDVSPGNVVASGGIEGDPGSHVSVVVNGDAAVANFHHKGRSFQLRENGNVTQIEELSDGHNEEHCGAIPAATADPAGAFEISLRGTQELAYSPLSAPTLDLLVAYTPQARARAGSPGAMVALIQMGIADTNRALADSGAGLKVRLAGTMETRQNETGNFSGDLDRLRGTGDGLWDEVHRERQRLGADQVSLVGLYSNQKSVGGIGYINATKATAFTIVKVSNFSQYTFAHELGHNLGLHHTDGYVNSDFRTIIAYGNSPRIRRFSNPERPYNGMPTGTSTKNEVRIINRNAGRVAAFMNSSI